MAQFMYQWIVNYFQYKKRASFKKWISVLFFIKIIYKKLTMCQTWGIYDEKDSACIRGVNTVNWESRWVSQQLKLG